MDMEEQKTMKDMHWLLLKKDATDNDKNGSFAEYCVVKNHY